MVLSNVSMRLESGKNIWTCWEKWFWNLKLLAVIRNKMHVGKYSLGMRQRLGLAQALMEHPDILLLDEPLSGLDNDGVEEMYKILFAQKEQGKLLLFASHSKEDINILCDEIFRFDRGKIVAHEILNE